MKHRANTYEMFSIVDGNAQMESLRHIFRRRREPSGIAEMCRFQI
jgi:hypothetical protein